MTQNQRILKHLESGKKITSIEAVNRWSVTRLSARIHELVSMGVKIKKQWQQTKNGKYVVAYSL